jgi:hypothetical protein
MRIKLTLKEDLPVSKFKGKQELKKNLRKEYGIPFTTAKEDYEGHRLLLDPRGDHLNQIILT